MNRRLARYLAAWICVMWAVAFAVALLLHVLPGLAAVVVPVAVGWAVADRTIGVGPEEER